jgi:hypothetical protein
MEPYTSKLADYQSKIETAQGWKADGFTEVAADMAGADLAKGRLKVPIDEYIQYWSKRITLLQAGINSDDFPY